MQVDSSAEIGHFLFLFFFFGFTGSFIVLTASILIMHYLMPKAVIERYFKPPYFREFEYRLFSGVPYAPMRTIMFMRAIAFPNSGKKRGITHADKLVSNGYKVASKIVVISILVLGVSMFLVIFGYGGYLLATEPGIFF